ncbi:MAG: cytochrome c, partial [Bacteroidetes bacterium]
MKYAPLWPLALLFLTGTGFLEKEPTTPQVWISDSSLQDVLATLGEPTPLHRLAIDGEMVVRGEEIVKKGRTTNPNGTRSRYISKYYVCTSCHNLEREDPDLRISEPETRLSYVKERGLPFLQGTTFRGIVNRESWYNDDYIKKYGDEKIRRANHNLREAIQLCAIECSQGRPMESWEIDAVLAYFWTLEWKLGDLGLSEADYARLNNPPANEAEKLARRQWLKSLYLQKSPAHFFDAPPNKYEGYEGLTGDPRRGKDLYDLSCLHCHKAGGVSHYLLDYDKLTFRHLQEKIPKDSHFSLYQIIAYGTYAIPGHRPYMPHYPLERMSKQQVEDLRAFVEFMAAKNNRINQLSIA